MSLEGLWDPETVCDKRWAVFRNDESKWRQCRDLCRGAVAPFLSSGFSLIATWGPEYDRWDEAFGFPTSAGGTWGVKLLQSLQ